MKNVTPKVGQTWKFNDGDHNQMVISNNDEYGNPAYGPISSLAAKLILERCTFVPQNDLEWLAIYGFPESEWKDNNDWYVSKIFGRVSYCNIKSDNNYTRQQWQNMRYDLGLDEKPASIEVEAVRAQANIIRKIIKEMSPMSPIAQKETKMIDLSTAKVGDRFKCSNDQYELVTLVYIGKDSERFIFENEYGGMMIVDDDGLPIVGHPDSMHIKSKHDPRHWLKDLPDADLIEGSWIACDDCSNWYTYASEPNLEDRRRNTQEYCFSLGGIKTPKLKVDEWKLSKISIPDLKAWQEQAKR